MLLNPVSFLLQPQLQHVIAYCTSTSRSHLTSNTMASTASPHWEVVGKGKKSKIPTPVSRGERKKIAEGMPKVEHYTPALKESSTLFNVFLEKEKKQQQANAQAKAEAKDSSKTNGFTNAGKKPVQQKKKPQKIEPEKLRPSSDFLEAVAEIKKDDLEAALMVTKSSFPGNIEVWLKDLASLLNIKLEQCPEPDPFLKNKAKDFPMCHLSNKCQDVVKSVIREASAETLEHLLYHSITTMLSEMNKGNSSYGYRIFIQMLVYVKPNIALTKTQQYLELLTTHQNKLPRCLSILWCLGVCGNKDFRSGLRVWMEVMMPMLKVRPVAPYCVEYLEELFRTHTDMKKLSGEMSLKEYFFLVDMIFNDQNMPKDLAKKLQTLYPKLKKIALANDKTPGLRQVFPSYLTRVTPGSGRTMKSEVLPCLVDCLATDKQCFAVWCQMYTKHLSQSSVLLNHLAQNWNKVGSKIDKKLFQSTLRSFSITNEELATQGRNSSEGYQECVAACKELLQKMEQTHFPWFWMVFLFLISTLSAIIAYDIYSSKTLKASRTVRFLEDYGILAFTEQVWSRLTRYTLIAFSWLRVNIPLYAEKAINTISPYVALGWSKITFGIQYVWEVSTPHREWLYIKLLQLTDQVYSLSPDLWSDLSHYLSLSWDFLRDKTYLIWTSMVQLFLTSWKWIETEVLLGQYTPDVLQQFFRTAISFVQSSTISFTQWCSNLFQTSQGK
ncbi:transmembrane protein 214-like [Ostrea edulis]|uniref:transmembrane protein 214-like n=1 Tax=Ostrea edulis TaxID=37623 RepID=UPI0024AF8C4E|nr:transmembrane protein 214-like [Ostrea edulis]